VKGVHHSWTLLALCSLISSLAMHVRAVRGSSGCMHRGGRMRMDASIERWVYGVGLVIIK
jgi:hypothetical protein